MKEYKSLNARCWVGRKKSDLGDLWQWAVSRGQESQHPVSLTGYVNSRGTIQHKSGVSLEACNAMTLVTKTTLRYHPSFFKDAQKQFQIFWFFLKTFSQDRWGPWFIFPFYRWEQELEISWLAQSDRTQFSQYSVKCHWPQKWMWLTHTCPEIGFLCD